MTKQTKERKLTIEDTGREYQLTLAITERGKFRCIDYTTADIDLRSNRLRVGWWRRHGYTGRLSIVDRDIESQYVIEV